MDQTITLTQALDLISEQQSEIILANNNIIDSIIQDQEHNATNIITEAEHEESENLLENLDTILE